MAVHRINHDMVSFTGHLQTWNITLLGNRHLKRTHLLALYVIAPYADIWIPGTSHGIFVFIVIQPVVLHLWLIIANPANHLSVTGKCKCCVETEFFFVHPVWYAVYDLIALTVFGHLRFGIVIKQTDKVDVIVAYESDVTAVRTPYGGLLRAEVAQWLQYSRLNVIDVIVSRERTTVDALHFVPNQHSGTVRTHLIATYFVHFATQCLANIKENTRLIAWFQGVFHYLFALIVEYGVSIASG